MKRKLLIMIIILLSIICSGCTSKKKDVISERLELDLSECKITKHKDTHGGFLGDGDYFAKIECTNKIDETIRSNWKELPISDEINTILELVQCNSTSCKSAYDKYGIPKISNGYYFFLDRHSMSTGNKDDSELNTRSSYNFSLGIYDLDTNIIYYYELDT